MMGKMMFEDCCVNFCITSLNDLGNHHHKSCSNYKTKKYPYLFYYEEGLDRYIPVPKDARNMVALDCLDPDEKCDFTYIKFRRFDLTDEEYDNLEEA